MLFTNLNKDYLTYLIGKGLTGLATVLGVPLMTRLLGVDGYGKYAWLWSILFAFAQFSVGWLQQGIIRFGSTESLKIIKQPLRWILSLVFGFIIMGVFALLEQSLFEILLSGSFVMLWFYWGIKQAILQIEFEVLKSVTADIIRTWIPLIIFWLFLIEKSEHISVWVILAILNVGLIIAHLYLVIVPKKETSNTSSSDRFDFSTFFKYGIPISLWIGLSLMHVVITRSHLQILRLTEELGVFSALQEIALKSGSLIFIPLMSTIHPRLMTYWKNNNSVLLKRTMRLGFSYLLLFSVVLTLILGFGQDLIFKLLFVDGAPLTLSLDLLLWIVLAEWLGYWALFSHKGFEWSKKTYLMAIIMSLSLALNFLLLQLPSWGTELTGIIQALCISRLFYVIVSFGYTLRLLSRV